MSRRDHNPTAPELIRRWLDLPQAEVLAPLTARFSALDISNTVVYLSEVLRQERE